MVIVNQFFDVDGAQQAGNDRCVPSEAELAMGSRLQSNGATQAAKVDSLIPSAVSQLRGAVQNVT
jgi:hypothetical protein